MSPGLFDPFILLPKDHPPKLPKNCVDCFSPDPAHGVTLWESSNSLLGALPGIGLLLGGFKKVTFSACRPCAWKLRVRRLVSFVVMLGSMVGLGFAMSRWSATWPRKVQGPAVGGGILAGVLLGAVVDATLPAAVRLHLRENTMEYYFRNGNYAIEFKVLNREAMILK